MCEGLGRIRDSNPAKCTDCQQGPFENEAELSYNTNLCIRRKRLSPEPQPAIVGIVRLNEIAPCAVGLGLQSKVIRCIHNYNTVTSEDRSGRMGVLILCLSSLITYQRQLLVGVMCSKWLLSLSCVKLYCNYTAGKGLVGS